VLVCLKPAIVTGVVAWRLSRTGALRDRRRALHGSRPTQGVHQLPRFANRNHQKRTA
jgi:hypothetical protein